MRIFQEQDSTLKKYGATLVKLVLNIARYDLKEFEKDKDQSLLSIQTLNEMNTLKRMLTSINQDDAQLFDPKQEHILQVKKVIVTVFLRSYGGGFQRDKDFLFIFWMKLCLQEEQYSVKYPSVCSQYIAHLHYFIRVIIIGFLVNIEEDLSKSRAEKAQRFEFYLQFIKTAGIAQTPFSILEQAMRLCSTHTNQMERNENLIWIDQGRNLEMLVGSIRVSPSILFQSIDQLYTAAKDKLKKTILPWLDVDTLEKEFSNLKMIDQLNEPKVGYSIQDIEVVNALVIKYFGILSKDHNYHHWIHQEGNQFEISRYLTSVKQFVQILLTLIHLSSGQPARMTELQYLLLFNTSNHFRSIYVYDGYIQLVFDYNKTTSICQQSRKIIRFLPKKFNGIFLIYVTIIRTIER